MAIQTFELPSANDPRLVCITLIPLGMPYIDASEPTYQVADVVVAVVINTSCVLPFRLSFVMTVIFGEYPYSEP